MRLAACGGDGGGDPDPMDTTKPVITLTGANPQAIIVGNTYTELGATATDNLDGDITANIVVDASAVNTDQAGDYTVTYNVSDAASNAADQIVRTVTVSMAAVLGTIQIDSIGVTITYDEKLDALSETVMKIDDDTPITNTVVFADSPDNTITINADLSAYTIDSNFTVDITANIEDRASNADSTKITTTINP
ncbi:MAG: DUF5011 domain-containing protein [Gammaproteobacteria bacterium]|nr:DUF5011 domain-containing protein [Gammaproteobacteria bacterium]